MGNFLMIKSLINVALDFDNWWNVALRVRNLYDWYHSEPVTSPRTLIVPTTGVQMLSSGRVT
jgi:hypothetical protein